VRTEPHKLRHGLFAIITAAGVLLGAPALAQLPAPSVPPRFTLDLETAARLRPQLMAHSVSALGRYPTAGRVFSTLLAQIPNPPVRPFLWTLRIVDDGQLNAYSSADGAIYVEDDLARLAGSSPGLWAAILAHEIAHVISRDWARRYLFEQTLVGGAGSPLDLGAPGSPAASWTDSRAASAEFAQFCRQLEIEADRSAMMLMARGGYHPHFLPALDHLLHAHQPGPASHSPYAMHPCWEDRDRELALAYVEASSAFDRLWPAAYASPGGNPPVLVFADPPDVRKTRLHEWEVRVPMRCENLAGAVEVVLRDDSSELRQLTGCTSPRTTITFTLASLPARPASGRTNVYILDADGAVLARADLPRPPR